MGVRGTTVDILTKPTDAGELDEFERVFPVQVESKNIRRTLAGGWRKSFGLKGTGVTLDTPCAGMAFHQGRVFAISMTGSVYAFEPRDPSSVVEIGKIRGNTRPQMESYDDRLIVVGGGRPQYVRSDGVYTLGYFMESLTPPAPTVTRIGNYSGTPSHDGVDPMVVPTTTSGEHGIHHRQYVYAVRWISPVGGVGPMSSPSDPVESTGVGVHAAIRVELPTIRDRNVTGIQVLRANAGDSQWRVVHTELNSDMFVYIDTAATPDLEVATFGNTYAGMPPDGAKYVAVIDDIILLAGWDDISFAWCTATEPDWWPSDNRLQVQNDGGRITGLLVFGRELYIFKTNNIEVWVHSGGPTSFQRRNVIERGCIAPESILLADNEIYFLGNDGDYYVIQNGMPVIVSGVMTASLVAMEHKEEARAFEFRRERVIKLVYPKDKRCFVYDFLNKAWSEDARYFSGEWVGTVYDGHAESQGQGFACANSVIGVFEVDEKTYSVNTYRKVTVPLTGPYTHSGRVSRMRLRVKRGDDTPARSPSLFVRWSFDRGEWSEPEYINLSGTDQDPYVDFFNLGYGKEMTVEFQEGSSTSLHISNAVINVVNLRT